MILNQKDTAIAYRCPSCGQTIVSMVGIFALSGDLIKLKCSCGESELLLSYTADRKIRLNVPCLMCGVSHPYLISAASLFERDLLALSCGCCGVDICFIGSKEKVLDAAATSDRELLEMMEEAGMHSFDELQHDNVPENDEDYYFIENVLNFLLSELEEDHRIHCSCPADKTPSYRYRIIPGDEEQTVEIFCETCGAALRLPVSSATEANDLLNADDFYLKKDDTEE